MSDHTTNRAGYEQAGEYLGAGSGLHVVRALAVGGQVVRVVFSAEPKHRSASAIDDGRNPSNYDVTITVGAGQRLQVVGVSPDVIAWPAYGLWAASEFALDIHTDRVLVVGLQYRVTVKTPLVSALGESVGSPYAATFIGTARPTRTRQARRNTGLTDFASDPFTGGILVDSAGDWASHDGIAGTRKRIWRITLTPKGSFAFLPNFGLNHDIKKPATLSVLTGLRTDLRQQILQQPDVKSSSTAVVMDSRGLLNLTVSARTQAGQDISDTVKATPDGGIIAL